jgi:hypothetical protein
MLNLPDHQMKLLLNREKIDDKIYFMVYDQIFITYVGELGNSPKNYLRHIFWIVWSLSIYYILMGH